jgi:sulfur relay (sulfurtransferase) complex TusBCD TusD component (DsrE family)
MAKRLTKNQVTLIARNYIKSMFIYADGFYCENESLCSDEDQVKIQKEILRLVNKICPENLEVSNGDVEGIIKDVIELDL